MAGGSGPVQGAAPQQGSPASSQSPGLHPWPPLPAPPELGSGNAISHSAQPPAWTTQHVGAEGPGSWKWASESFAQVFDKKKFFFTYWKTLSNLLYISTGSLPLPPNRLWGFSLKQGEDAPWFFRAQNCKVTKFELGVH